MTILSRICFDLLNLEILGTALANEDNLASIEKAPLAANLLFAKVFE